jgi:hypothetical protein
MSPGHPFLERAQEKCPPRDASIVLRQSPKEGECIMSEFTYLYRGGMPPGSSPEEMQQRMQKWIAWFKELGQKGHLKDQGRPLERTGKVVKGKEKSVNDGPYAEAKDLIGGFTLIEATDLAQAVELSKGCPIFDVGGSVEVRPVMKIEM